MAAIDYESLCLMLGDTRLRIISLTVSEGVGRHGYLTAEAETGVEEKDYLLYEEKGNVALYAVMDGSPRLLFSGSLTRMEVHTAGGRCEVQLKAATWSSKMDADVRNRSFQDTAMTSRQLISKVMEPYPQKQLLFSIPDVELGRIAVQYQETDWAFLNRLLSGFGSALCVDSAAQGICLRAGLMDTEEDADWDALPYTVSRDTAPADVEMKLKGQLCYRVEAYDVFPPGEKVRFHEKDLYIGRAERAVIGGLFVSTYFLYFGEGLAVSRYYNPYLTGVSINGYVQSVKRDRLRARLETDALTGGKKQYFFPFSTVAASPDGSGWYCMPKKGDMVRVFFPTWDEGDGYAIASIKGESAPTKDSPVWDTDLKDITAPDGKTVRFIKDGIQVSTAGGKAAVRLTNDGKAEIKADEEKDIQIWAENEIRFTAQEAMVVAAGRKIEIENNSGGNITMERNTIEIEASIIKNN
nr:contractile injection system protein, VgrG/Pvc8 family [uncultured Acetatifactor sp.]